MFDTDVPLREISNYKIGGSARYFFAARTYAQLEKATESARKQRLPIFILGGGTNVLINDAGFGGLILAPCFCEITVENNEMWAGAGASMASLIEAAADAGLSGLEWAGGLPGTLGGAIRGNAGAFGGEIGDAVAEVLSFDMHTGKFHKRNQGACGFGYRSSVFKKCEGREIIVGARFILKNGKRFVIRNTIKEKIRYRMECHPMEYPNIGSIFKNVSVKELALGIKNKIPDAHIKSDPFPVVPAAHLISECGLGGVSCGGAMISPKHPNFIVNVLSASSSDVEQLIHLVKHEVKNKFAIVLEEEIVRL